MTRLFKSNCYYKGRYIMETLTLGCGLCQLTEDKKPNLREKLFRKGARALSDVELLSIMLRTGTAQNSLSQLSKKVLKCVDKNVNEESMQNLRKIKGLGDSKISVILAGFELGRRYHGHSYGKINEAIAVLPYLKHYARRKTEHFIVISLTGANEIINIRVVSTGTLTNTLVHPREVFSDVILDRAAAVIFAHNHPSGNVEPSTEDIDLTYRLIDSATILGIDVLDHIIFSERENYVSLAERGIIES